MSNDSSASETTPLRRPEENLSCNHLPEEDSLTAATVTSDLLTTRNGFPVATTTSTSSAFSQNAANYQQNVRASNTIASIANHNNNRIEVRLSCPQQQNIRHRSDQPDLNHRQPNGTCQTQPPYVINMDTTNKRILCRVGLDILILICGKYLLTHYTLVYPISLLPVVAHFHLCSVRPTQCMRKKK